MLIITCLAFFFALHDGCNMRTDQRARTALNVLTEVVEHQQRRAMDGCRAEDDELTASAQAGRYTKQEALGLHAVIVARCDKLAQNFELMQQTLDGIGQLVAASTDAGESP
jgi:hypothetical protein